MRLLTDEKYLDDPDVEVEFLPRTESTVAAFVKTYKGKPVKTVLDRIVSNVTQLRKDIRKAMKSERDPKTLVSMDAAQLTAKVIQNSVKHCLRSRYSCPCRP